MAEVVVDRLEAIDVDHEHADGLTAEPDLEAFEVAFESATVPKARQRVGAAQPIELAVACDEFVAILFHPQRDLDPRAEFLVDAHACGYVIVPSPLGARARDLTDSLPRHRTLVVCGPDPIGVERSRGGNPPVFVHARHTACT